MVRISDARMSGTSYGACVLHVAPESFVGGPLALVAGRRRDRARRRRRAGSTAGRRRRAGAPPRRVAAAAAAYARGYGAMFAQHITQADEGCDFDFLERGRADARAGDPLNDQPKEATPWTCPSTTSSARSRPGARRSASGQPRRATSRSRSWPGPGFDWLLLDTEHSPNELPMVYSQLQAAMDGPAQPIVRPPWNDMVMIKRFLDTGVQTLLIPYDPDREEARAGGGVDPLPAARRARLRLGVARVALRPGQGLPHALRRRRSACWCRSRPGRALDNLEAIAAVEGVDGVFIGPGDLSAGSAISATRATPTCPPVHRGRDRPDQGRRQGAGHPDRRRGAGAALHRAGLPVHRRRRRLRHPGAGLRAARRQVQESHRPRERSPRCPTRTGRIVSILPREDSHAEIRGQSHHALQRARLPRPLRRGRRGRVRGVEYLFPYAYPKDAAGRTACKEHGLTQVLHNLPAGDWAGGRARHRLPSGPRRGVPGRRRQGHRVRHALWAASSSTAWPASPPRTCPRTRCAGPSSSNLQLRRTGAGQGRHQAADRADQHPRHPGLLS